MMLQTLQVGPLMVNCYIVGDEHTREVVVIDPGGDVRRIYDTLTQARSRVLAIVLTHAHFDHVLGVAGLKQETGAPLLLGEEEAPTLASAKGQAEAFGLAMPPLPSPDRLLREGDEIAAGEVRLNVLSTPGHTPGGICLSGQENKIVFSGDTLMRGGIGRTDFPGGSMEALLRSIRTKLLTLPPETIVYPGHGMVTTIGEEKMLNPFLQHHA
jgi:hydroxyacylglutathione hydrolase